MGGYGSGRSGGAPVIEDGLILDIDKLRRDGLVGPNVSSSGSLTWTTAQTGREVATIGFIARIGDDEGSLRLYYTATSNSTGEKIRSDYEIRLETVPQPFGGRRWFFVCPHLGVRCSKLYKLPGSSRFLSRGAYRNFAYRSQRESPRDRALTRAFELRRQIGDQGGIDDWIVKPKWMRWKTFERRKQRIRQVEAVVKAHYVRFLNQFSSRT